MIRYAYRLSQGVRGRIGLGVACGLIRVIAGLAFVVFCKMSIDIATGLSAGSIGWCVTAIVATLVTELVCTSIEQRTGDLAEAALKNSIQERLFCRVMNMEWHGREQFHSGDVLSRLTEDSRVVADCLCHTVPAMLVSVSQFAGAFVFLCYFSPVLAVVLAFILPVFLISGKAFFKKTRVLTRRLRGIESHLQEQMQENLRHRIVLLTSAHAGRTMKKISSLLDKRYDVLRQRTGITVFTRTSVLAGFELGYLAAFVWGIAGLSAATITYGVMTAYLQLAARIQRPMSDVARQLPAIVQSHTALSRLAEIETMPEMTQSPGSVPETSMLCGIKMRDVTFSYPGKSDRVFDMFSHDFRPGSCTAIIGETGAGKSTLLRLALGLLRPQHGQVLMYHGEEARRKEMAVSPAVWGDIVYVPQGNSLFSGTIRRNLLIGNPEATESEMWEALHDAAADFVEDLRFGLETPCGENGDGLSEGQAQRIAVARALLRPGSILLLDEISASLDEDTEKTLMRRLGRRRGANTILMVTHRTGVLKYCDCVLRLSAGHFQTEGNTNECRMTERKCRMDNLEKG